MQVILDYTNKFNVSFWHVFLAIWYRENIQCIYRPRVTGKEIWTKFYKTVLLVSLRSMVFISTCREFWRPYPITIKQQPPSPWHHLFLKMSPWPLNISLVKPRTGFIRLPMRVSSLKCHSPSKHCIKTILAKPQKIIFQSFPKSQELLSIKFALGKIFLVKKWCYFYYLLFTIIFNSQHSQRSFVSLHYLQVTCPRVILFIKISKFTSVQFQNIISNWAISF